MIRCFLAFSILCCAAQLQAQIPIDTMRRDSLPPIDSSDTEALDSLENRRYIPLLDTTRVHYYYWSQPQKFWPVDTSLADFERVKVAWEERGTLDLGVLGSPQVSLQYRASQRGGFWTGLDAAEPYRLHLERLPIYTIAGRRPFTDIYYSQISQKNTNLRATFAHEASPKLYYMLHYGLTNAFGFFDRQGVRNQNLALALRYRQRRSESWLAFFNTSYTAQENGGLALPSLVDGTSSTLLSGLPVWLNFAETQQGNTQIHWAQSWNNRPDSSANFALGYSLTWSNNTYKYFDTSPDNTYYLDYQTNARGLRRYFQHQYAEAALQLRYAMGGSLQQAPPLALLIRGIYRLHNLSETPLPASQQHNIGSEAFLNFDLGKSNIKYLRGQAQARLWLANSKLDIYLGGNLQMGLNNWLGLEAEAFIQRAQAGQIQKRLYISQVLVWDRQLAQQQDIHLQAALSVPRIGLKLGASNQTITNYIYSDTNKIVQQSTSQAINIISAYLKEDIAYKGFGISAEARFQSVLLGADMLPLPTWQTQATLYWEGRVFKKLRLRTGAKVRYWSPFAMRGYFPLTQQFYVQQYGDTPIYPVVDCFVSAHIYQARVFLSAENLTHLFNQRNYFTAFGYAMPNFLLRFGLSWRLFD